MARIRGFLLLAGLVVLAGSTGCGGQKKVKVTGAVVQDGKPLPVTTMGGAQITLVPEVAPGGAITTHVGYADEQGKFEILNVPPGKYKVAVTYEDKGPGSDKFGGKFSQDNTKIRREVDGSKPLTIDVAKPEG
jgi:hypothetical protein